MAGKITLLLEKLTLSLEKHNNVAGKITLSLEKLTLSLEKKHCRWKNNSDLDSINNDLDSINSDT